MKKPCSNSRYYSIPSLLVALTLTLSVPLQAGEVPLRAFVASYEVTAKGLSVGSAELSLAPLDQLWRWRLTTRARGIYKLFIRDKPYSETTFSQGADELRLRRIVIADENDRNDVESASFDWERGQVEVIRKGRQRQLALTEDVYDLQTIHVLAASMQLEQRDDRRVQFYRKGKLVESRLVYLGNGSIDIGGGETEVRIYEHSISGSKDSLKYYYDANDPLLPLLIESSKSGKKRSMLKLRKVEWQS